SLHGGRCESIKNFKIYRVSLGILIELDFIFDISKIFPTILPENGSLHRTVLDGIDRTKRANNDLNILIV
ncbi:TPA: hypothetical protein ACKKAS_001276, partial [Neisseria gonorrhoeae]